MSIRPSEQFHANLISQYRDIVHEAVLECESDHRTRIDLGMLATKFKSIVKAAIHDGLTEEEIHWLIDDTTTHESHKKAA